MARHTIQELQQWQSLPLNVKILMTKQRIRDWINEYGEDGINICIDILRNFYEVGNEEQNKFMRMLENELMKKRDE